jgi:hypothetical protein
MFNTALATKVAILAPASQAAFLGICAYRIFLFLAAEMRAVVSED